MQVAEADDVVLSCPLQHGEVMFIPQSNDFCLMTNQYCGWFESFREHLWEGKRILSIPQCSAWDLKNTNEKKVCPNG
jgi:hypothetical protein